MIRSHDYGGEGSTWGLDTQPQRFAAILRHVPLGARILDLGAGRGAYTRSLNEKGYPTVGADARRWEDWDRMPSGWFIQAHAENLPFEDKSFQATIAFEVLEHCENPKRVLAEIARCTSDLLILSVPDCDLNNQLRRFDLAMAHWTDTSHRQFFTRKTLCDLLETTGFEVLEVSGCYPIDPNDYFWTTIRLPRWLAYLGHWLCKKFRLTPSYFSSILVTARLPGAGTGSGDA